MPPHPPPSATLHPVILSGGSGTRLWPLSRTEHPKQLLALAGDESMLQATVRRALALPGAAAPIVVAGEDQRHLVREQLAAIGCLPAALLLEPEGRNTAPAIALAALHLAGADPSATMLVLPADHVVLGQAAFAQCVATALPAAHAGHLCTFGIVPERPETGYGYIRAPSPLAGLPGVMRIERFVEKPDPATARALLAEGGHCWNSGMFLFTAQALLDELGAFEPAVSAAVQRAWRERAVDTGAGFVRPGAAAFRASPSISVDHAVMQRTRRAAMAPAGFGWSDVGDWDGLWRVSPRDGDGNTVLGDVLLHGTRDSYVRAERRLVAVVGLDNVAVVETPDAVLVMRKDRAQDVRHVVAQLQAAGRDEALRPARVHRPWGWYEGTDRGERFQVKRLMLAPGRRISLQMHHHRAEHWIVVSGTALVTIDGEQRLLRENESAFVPLGRRHRLENPGSEPLHLVEVQSGAYLGEDDIVRFGA